MQVDHYENFPVASLALPRRYREPVRWVYHFARSADDFADEGELPDAERLRLLGGYRSLLDAIGRGEMPAHPILGPLAGVIRQYDLPLTLFTDLLSAFEQDVTVKRYASYADLADYCRRSANPVGRILLHLFGQATPRNLACSDGICTALQLINFWQDVTVDWQKGRVYLPQEDLARFNVSEAQIEAKRVDPRWQALMAFEVDRALRMLQGGAGLGLTLPGRLGLEIRLVVLGGETVLRKIHAARGDVLTQRPVVAWHDMLRVLPRALLPRLAGRVLRGLEAQG
ncbi:MAG: squalene synthase HpnC [Burkholderiales bacterium]